MARRSASFGAIVRVRVVDEPRAVGRVATAIGDAGGAARLDRSGAG
jgi:hypothetical protein